MDLYGVISDLLNKLANLLANTPVLAIIGAVAGILGFVIVQWKKIKKLVNEAGQCNDNRFLNSNINPPLANSFEESKKEPILGAYTEMFPLSLVVKHELKEIEIDLNPGGIIIGKMPSKSMTHAVETLRRHISQNLSDYCIIRDQKKLLMALEAFLFKCIVEKSGINSSFETVAKKYLNRVNDDCEIGPIFRTITNLNKELKDARISFDDMRLLRILLLESCGNRSGIFEVNLNNLIKFLKAVDQKAASEDISPVFDCNGISIALVLIGRYEKMKHMEENFNPYVSFIEGAAREGITAFYILARGALNCFVADITIAQVTKGNVLTKNNEYRDEVEYEGRKVSVICSRLENLTVLKDPVTAYRESLTT